MESKQFINNRFLSFTIVMLLITGNLFAQPPQRGGMQGPPPLPDSTQIVQMVDELATTISLSDDQKTQVSDLYFAHFEEARELMEEHEGDREGHREAMEDLREEFDDQVKDLLSKDQVEKFEKFIKNRPKPQGENRPKRR